MYATTASALSTAFKICVSTATLALGATIPKIKSDLQAVVTALNYMNRDLDSFVSPDALHGAVRLPFSTNFCLPN